MVEKTILDCGLKVISEYRPELPSFALSYSLRSGSRAEILENNGIHHFIEHMLFKGCEKYDLKQIASLSDQLGGTLNAFTGKEITQFYLNAIDEKFDLAFDLLTEVVLNAGFPDEEFLKERNVILQEINESEDNPDTHVFESFYALVFPSHPLGFPISGSSDQVLLFSRDKVYRYYQKLYAPENLVLSVAGNVNHFSLVEKAGEYFSGFANKLPDNFSFKKPEMSFITRIEKKESLKQTYAIIGFEGIPFDSPNRYPFLLMNEILGAGMSSRLFQKIREEKGIAYTVSSFLDSQFDSGSHLIYAIAEPEKMPEYLQAVKQVILELKEKGIEETELNRARDHLKSSIILGLESNMAKMQFNVMQDLYLKKEFTINEILEQINETGTSDIKKLLDTYVNLDQASILLYGNVNDGKLEKFSFF
jgi:predicted Zn-dependent peptidase